MMDRPHASFPGGPADFDALIRRHSIAEPIPRDLRLRVEADSMRCGWSYDRRVRASEHRVDKAAAEALASTAHAETMRVVHRYASVGAGEQRRVEFMGTEVIAAAYGPKESARDDRIRAAARERGVVASRKAGGPTMMSRHAEMRIRSGVSLYGADRTEYRFDLYLPREQTGLLGIELQARGSTFSVEEWVGLLAMLELEAALKPYAVESEK